MSTVFFRLLSSEDKAADLSKANTVLAAGLDHPTTYLVPTDAFQEVPGSPFAYWVSDRVRGLFSSLEPFEADQRHATKGLATTNDFRFLRAWWEPAWATLARYESSVIPSEMRSKWVPFAKGGTRSPYYADILLVVDWENNGQSMKDYLDDKIGQKGQWSRWINATNYYFQPGLTWPLRASHFAPSVLPTGSIFSVRGYVIIAPVPVLGSIAALGNSSIFDFLFKIMLGRFGYPEFVVGVLQQLPMPAIADRDATRLRSLALNQVEFKRSLDRANEISHVFLLPALLQLSGDSLAMQVAAWESRVAETNTQVIEHQQEIDDIAFRLYGIDGEDRHAIEASLGSPASPADEADSEVGDVDPEDAADAPADAPGLIAALLSYAVGCTLGRWDVRHATGELPTPTLPDPFAPLPVCSPGMLTGEDGQPTLIPPPGYPLHFDADGILADDPDHDDDIVRRVRAVLDLVFGHHAEAIEREACQILGVRDLRDYFRKPGAGGFWADHIRRYSKSRRKAPIYWLLQSPKRGYGLWLYYHRLDGDILYKAQINYVEPKLRQVTERLDELRAQRTGATTPRDARQADRAIEQQEALLADVAEFSDRLKRAADLGLAPDLNDGVVLTIAPLRELVPWPEAKRYWQELLAGKYEWSSIGKQLRAKGLVK